jgi:glutamine cyclotransferase
MNQTRNIPDLARTPGSKFSAVALSWAGRIWSRFFRQNAGERFECRPSCVLGERKRMNAEGEMETGFRPESTRLSALLLILIVFLLQTPGQQPRVSGGTPNRAVASHAAGPALRSRYRVVNSYPHDRTAFLQGLVWHDGGFYESTGLAGHSTLRRVKFPSGQVTKSISLAPELFGEGLAMVGDELIQLTWQSHRGFVYNRESFALMREFSYATEGWGLTYDGTNLILSDGSDGLTYLDARTFEPLRRLPVTWDGNPQFNLNELEFIEGEVWANVWNTDFILRIDPSSGRVTSYLDLKGILAPETPRESDDVLNGIAYDSVNKRIFVGGKRWPRLFEIKLTKLINEKAP